MMTKGELAWMLLTKEEQGNIDYALPHSYVVQCREMGMPDPRRYTVWSFINNGIGGEPLNLAELYVTQMEKRIQDEFKNGIGAINVRLESSKGPETVGECAPSGTHGK